jgi:hypothetical protein
MWNLALVRLDMGVVSVFGVGFAPDIPLAHKSFLTHLMVLQGDEAQVEGRFGPFRDSANLDTR